MERKYREFKIIEFYIAITNRCNLGCIMCTTGKGRFDAQKELTEEEWMALISNLDRNCAIERITFGGGEPLLREDLAAIMKFACSTGIGSVNLISNGVLLDEKFMDKFDEKELNKIGIILSIDGLEYEHNFIRGTGVFQRTFSNFEGLYRDYFKNGRINSLTLSSILIPENFAHYISYLEFFKKYEGVRIDIQPVIPNNEICYLKEPFKLTETEKSKLQEIVNYVINNIDLSTRNSRVIKSYIRYFDNNLLKSGRCLTGYESLNITYEGYPYLCGKEILMPLHKFDFKEVFHSKAFQDELNRINLCKEPCLQGLHINPGEDYGSGN